MASAGLQHGQTAAEHLHSAAVPHSGDPACPLAPAELPLLGPAVEAVVPRFRGPQRDTFVILAFFGGLAFAAVVFTTVGRGPSPPGRGSSSLSAGESSASKDDPVGQRLFLKRAYITCAKSKGRKRD